MDGSNKRTMGIYIHIPFCVRKCSYCDFLSFPAGDDEKEQYVNALIKEIKCAATKQPVKDYTVSTVFFGGGTPSVIQPELICRILETIKSSFSVMGDCEITIECNPGTLNEENACMYRKVGFNRISLGLQSTDNLILKSIGRIHTYEEFLKSFDSAQKAGFDNINIDLMQALPGQDYNSCTADLSRAVKLAPSHISAYSLIVEPGTDLYDNLQKYPSLPDEDEERRMYYATCEILEKAGYLRYEISNYAKKGYECRHNIAYWERGNYLGLGLGASSLIDSVRTKNTENMKEYLECYNRLCDTQINNSFEMPAIKEREVLTKNDAMAEFMFLGLRMTRGVSALKFKQEFGVSMTEIFDEAIKKNMELGLLECLDNGNTYRLSKRGTDVGNIVMADFLLE